jgi:hypothetical protein
VADAGGGPLRPLRMGVAGRTSVLRQGRYLVVRVAEQLQKGPVLALAIGGPEGPAASPLGSALEVLPSPRPDRVWLLDRRARSPQRAFTLQEVELATGRRLAIVALPHDAEPVAMVDDGVLVRDLRAGLAVRDLSSGRERQRLGTDLTFVDATARLVAYVDDRGDLRLRDLATRRDQVVRPTGMPNWFPLGRPVAGAGCCDQFGAFSADGRHLAVYVQLRRPAQPGLAVVDIGRSEARPVPGSQAATPFGCQPCLGWSVDGLLFFFSGDRRLTWSPHGDPAGRRRARWTCHWTTRPPRSPAAWRPSIDALPAEAGRCDHLHSELDRIEYLDYRTQRRKRTCRTGAVTAPPTQMEKAT